MGKIYNLIMLGVAKAVLKKMDIPKNSFDPEKEPRHTVLDGEVEYWNDVCYASEYPQSYLDIYTVPTKNGEKRPTFFTIHGGGFVLGSKSMDDPMSFSSGTGRYYRRILDAGFNIVSINYALAPEYQYPVPIRQVNQAVEFLMKNGEKYGIDTSRIVLNGGSAGGNLAAQYANIVTNPDYAKEMNIVPAVKKENVKAVVLDNALFDGMRSGNVSANKFSFAFYLCRFAYMNWRTAKKDLIENNILYHTTSNFPPCYIVDGNEGTFDDQAHEFDELLTKLNVYHKANIIPRSVATLGHEFLIQDNPQAREDIEMKIAFLKEVLNKE